MFFSRPLFSSEMKISFEPTKNKEFHGTAPLIGQKRILFSVLKMGSKLPVLIAHLRFSKPVFLRSVLREELCQVYERKGRLRFSQMCHDHNQMNL